MTPKQQQQIRDEIIAFRDAQRELNEGRETITIDDMETLVPTLIAEIMEAFHDMITENVWRCLPDREWIHTKMMDYVDWEEAAEAPGELVIDHMAEMWHLDAQRIWHDEWWNDRAVEEWPVDDDR